MSSQPSTTTTTTSYSMSDLLIDMTAMFLSQAISKTVVAPLENAKLMLQTQEANPNIDPKFKDTKDYIIRIGKEQGIASIFRGNLANVARFLPAQMTSFAVREAVQKTMYDLFGPASRRNAGLVLLSGACAGAGSLAFVYPIDYLRTRMAVDVGEKRQFSGYWDCLQKTIQTDGVLGLYQGYEISVLGIVVYRWVYFGLYDILATLSPPGRTSFLASFLMGNFVAQFAGLATYPFDTVRRRLMLQPASGTKKYAGTWDCFCQTYNKEGIKGFYGGYLSNSIRGILGAFVLVAYDAATGTSY